MWFRAGHQTFFPPLEPIISMGQTRQCIKCPTPLVWTSQQCHFLTFQLQARLHLVYLGQYLNGLENLPPAKMYGLKLQENVVSPLHSLPKHFMSVVEQRTPSLLWLNLWYLQWWKLSLRLSCGRDIQNLSLWLHSYVRKFELMLLRFLLKAGIGSPTPLLMVGEMSQQAQILLG